MVLLRRTALVGILLAVGFVTGLLLPESWTYGITRHGWGAKPNRVARRSKADRELRKALREGVNEPAPLGGWGRFRSARKVESRGAVLDEAQIEAMRAIGYVSGSMEAPEEVALSGVTIHDRALAQSGLNLETDGHRASASLMDMDGRTLHRWELGVDDAFPGNAAPDWMKQGVSFWRRVHLLEDGSLLAIFEGSSLIKIDRDSRLLWSFPDAHHDLDVIEDGTIYVLTREWLPFPKRKKTKGTFTDFIVVLDPDGREIKRVSVMQAIENSPYVTLRHDVDRSIERFHTNTIEWLDGSLADKVPAFKKGNVLISLLRQNAIAVVDMSEQKVVWAAWGMWLKQHQPTVTQDGTLLVFDNVGNDGRSRVIEFDPATREVEWLYDGGDSGLLSLTCGSNQRLANGNTLITESDSGRAVEVTRDKKIVWEYYTPNRAGENDEFIATLFEVVRLPADFPLDWLDGATPPRPSEARGE